ncbi:TetR/AcrR family transcriptional regulator [Motiliproteus sp. MSK22-1]|uniref:TetR/AcrR family transcriptional regulator n=1 Tax=Motiliproteus sp. MSK22-1 TaxID=1897630 RepID=UPI0009753E28|nr:TetR/AcrR family transcriptional regulator [Motiliproteus sp. MSK22-1]OMH29116.1 TetR family transcriptional regulator [Motiliproteus sp. MSK22-1]
MPYSATHKAKTKERILKSATNLFCRYGFDKVSIAQVMKLAKMTHGAFYAHFDSKEALYKESFVAALKRSSARRLIKEPFSIKNLMALVTGYLNLDNLNKENTPSSEAFLSNDIGNSNVEVKKLYEQSYLTLVKLFENRLRALTRLKNSPLNIDAESIPDKSRAILSCLIGALAISKTINLENERQAILVAAQNQIFSILGIQNPEQQAESAV